MRVDENSRIHLFLIKMVMSLFFRTRPNWHLNSSVYLEPNWYYLLLGCKWIEFEVNTELSLFDLVYKNYYPNPIHYPSNNLYRHPIRLIPIIFEFGYIRFRFDSIGCVYPNYPTVMYPLSVNPISDYPSSFDLRVYSISKSTIFKITNKLNLKSL